MDSAETALRKIEAGATLVQLYSALVYEGPGLVGRIKRGVLAALDRENITLAALTGRKAAESFTASWPSSIHRATIREDCGL